MRYGNAAAFAFGYAWFGLVQCSLVENIPAGYKFGQLALQVLEKFNSKELKEVGKRTELGLAIARQIVEETHNGKLSCNSVLGEGTEFVIKISV